MLIDSNIDFVCCDNPHATELTLHILGAMGEHERDMISKRTKEALAAAKQRGVVLGNPNVGKMNSEAAMARDAFLRPILETMWAMPLREIAQELNNRNSCAPWRRVGSNVGDARDEAIGDRGQVSWRPISAQTTLLE
jgi:DNA invertase Pin-like site-specific DNA recombinase